jgi:tRNA (cmo5U34)-methyltransferase
MTGEDKVFTSPVQRASGFQFDETVASVFDDMLERSVPLYNEVQRMTVELAKNFAQKGSNVYDLGCSTGTTIVLLARSIPEASIRFIGCDSSAPMLEKCKEKLVSFGCLERCELVQQDLNEEIKIENASVVLMNYTLQFVRPLYRDKLVQSIYQGLRERGCLLMTEKIVSGNSFLNSLFIDLYYEYKRRKGYSDMEIAQKREALENVLIPYKMDENCELLRRNGFHLQDVFFRWYNFASFMAIKL